MKNSVRLKNARALLYVRKKSSSKSLFSKKRALCFLEIPHQYCITSFYGSELVMSIYFSPTYGSDNALKMSMFWQYGWPKWPNKSSTFRRIPSIFFLFVCTEIFYWYGLLKNGACSFQTSSENCVKSEELRVWSRSKRK